MYYVIEDLIFQWYLEQVMNVLFATSKTYFAKYECLICALELSWPMTIDPFHSICIMIRRVLTY